MRIRLMPQAITHSNIEYSPTAEDDASRQLWFAFACFVARYLVSASARKEMADRGQT
jgi:hypothetical protein